MNRNPKSFIVMGVTGSGKSTVGQQLAEKLECEFFDADNFHPEENVSKMSNGVPLNDDDRLPWLRALNDLILSAEKEGRSLVLACSALKASYRKILSENSDTVNYIYLRGTEKLIGDRLNARKNHFMNPALLTSQFDTLEEPSESEAIYVDITPGPDAVVVSILEILSTNFPEKNCN